MNLFFQIVKPVFRISRKESYSKILKFIMKDVSRIKNTQKTHQKQTNTQTNIIVKNGMPRLFMCY